MWIGLQVGKTEAHVTITWLGKHQRSNQELEELKIDVENLKKLCPIVLKFGEWATFGKPEDIKKGAGILVRKCKIVDEKQAQAFLSFHKKWYHHEQGEDEERKSRQSFHVSVSLKLSEQEIAKFDEAECNNIFFKY